MWIVERAGGVTSLLANQPDETLDGPIARQAEVDRAPALDGSEDWDWDAGQWVVNVARAEAWIDRQAGPMAIATARAVKVLEARMMAMGTNVNGLLAAEAAATGQDLADLAAIVIANNAADVISEVNRIVLKREARGDTSEE